MYRCVTGFFQNEEKKMIVTELQAAYALWSDLLFVYDAARRVFGRLEHRQDMPSQFAFMTMKSTASAMGPDIMKLIKEEAVLLEKRHMFENFLKAGNPRLSSFAARPSNVSAGIRETGAFLAEWNATSRRVFQLGHETQRLLEETDHQELELDDLTIPFPNFVIRFAKPFTFGQVSFGAVGFSEALFAEEATDRGPGWSFFFLPTDYEPIPKREKDRLLKDMEKSKRTPRALVELAMMLVPMGVKLFSVQSCFAPLHGNEIPRIASDDGVSQKALEITNKAHAIAVNLMAVMNRLGKRGGHQETFTLGGHASVVSTENIFDLGGMSVLDGVVEHSSAHGHDGDDMVDNSARRITPHWRRKHLRRRPGMGHLPDAPRDVKVPTTLVLGEFLRHGTLPVGTVTRI